MQPIFSYFFLLFLNQDDYLSRNTNYLEFGSTILLSEEEFIIYDTDLNVKERPSYIALSLIWKEADRIPCFTGSNQSFRSPKYCW